MRRFLVAGAALAAAAAVSGGLLLATAGPAGAGRDYYLLTRDLPAGASVAADALRVAHLQLGPAGTAVLGPADRGLLKGAVAAHELRAGELLDRADLAPVGNSAGDRRVVLIALSQLPPVSAGSRLDLLAVTNQGDRAAVTPVAAGLEVAAVSPGGVVLLVPARQASARVYLAATQRLVPVVVDPGSRGGDEAAVTSLDQALEALHP